jgi:hypothetical protein
MVQFCSTSHPEPGVARLPAAPRFNMPNTCATDLLPGRRPLALSNCGLAGPGSSPGSSRMSWGANVNQGTTVGGERAAAGQNPRSSQETGNDPGAKEGRDVVLGRGRRQVPSGGSLTAKNAENAKKQCVLESSTLFDG